MWSRTLSFYARFPPLVKCPINISILLFVFVFYLPFGMLVSNSLYIATFDLSIVLVLTLSQLISLSINQTINQSIVIVCLGLIGSSAMRWFILNKIKSTNHCRSIHQSYLIAASLLIFPGVQSIMYFLMRIEPMNQSINQSIDQSINQSTNQSQLKDPYPFSLFILPFVMSLFVSLSIIWVPTSDELACQSELDLLRETGLLGHVVRGKVASLRYFLLDHPISQSNKQSVSGSSDHHIHTQLHDDLSSQSLNQSINQSVSQSINQSKRTALVCLHGYGAGSLFFARSMARWSHLVDVYAVDLLGFGLSSHEPFTTSTPSEAEAHFVESLDRWRQSMNLDKMLLLGHSLGGFVAAAYALKYPHRTIAVILASPVGIPDPPVKIGRAPLRRLLGQLIAWMWQLGFTFASVLHCLGPLGPVFVDLVINARFGRLTHVASCPSFARYLYHINAHQGSGLSTFSSLITPTAHARLPLGERMKQGMKVPTFFIFGDHDWMYNAASDDVVKAMNERGVYSSLERISNSGHHVSFENIVEFEQVVMKRIRQVLKDRID